VTCRVYPFSMKRTNGRRNWTAYVAVAVVVAGITAAIALRGVPASAEPVRAGTNGAMIADSSGGSDAQMRTPKQIGKNYSFPVTLSSSEWRARLTPEQYYILRQQGTEAPFSGKYWNNHAAGTYYSAATGQPLFSSKDKFNSGTGWPSFTRPISADAVLLRTDTSLFMTRTEVVDSMSGSHLGHVFDDGPAPTGKRYCIDSDALIFVPDGGTPPKLITAGK
jgi:peptide-methionine (R)-S-oxide reductase